MEASKSEFERQLLDKLTAVCGAHVALDTELFASGLLNSIKFIAVMAFVETALARPVPTNRLSAEFFRTPRVIIDTFGAS